MTMSRPTQPTTLGIDFGTTNTVMATASGGNAAQVLDFDYSNKLMHAYRTVLCFFDERTPGKLTHRVESGPWGIDRFVEAPHECRFLQSIKTFAASPHFRDTTIQARRYKIENLIETFLVNHRGHLGDKLPEAPGRVVVGRPVVFAGSAPDPELALTRYSAAFSAFGYTDVTYVYEPVAAAFFFAQSLKQDATVLVADFGGGTSDFSIIRFERRAGRLGARPLGASGVGIAGDSFDARIVEHVVSPRVGKGTRYRSFGKELSIPSHYFVDFARWHTLSLLKSPKTLRELEELARAAIDPAGLERFITIIEEDLAYQMYRAVADVKVTLSSETHAPFHLKVGSGEIAAEVSRAEFEAWIAPDVAKIATAVDAALADANLAAGDIDRVFLTGGSSFVPAVRGVFDQRFAADRIETGNQFDSIAAGLALIGAEEDLSPWAAGAVAA